MCDIIPILILIGVLSVFAIVIMLLGCFFSESETGKMIWKHYRDKFHNKVKSKLESEDKTKTYPLVDRIKDKLFIKIPWYKFIIYGFFIYFFLKGVGCLG